MSSSSTVRGKGLTTSRTGLAVYRQLEARANSWLTAADISSMIAEEGRHKHGVNPILCATIVKRMKQQGYPVEIKQQQQRAVKKYRLIKDDSDNEEE
tara:strand:- start:1324 stop:1614 length:291 start_codon:yes stop_codon:yes gene_type:complete